jgi:hypothetical protein
MMWNLSAAACFAFGSGTLSGWHFSTSLRYADLMAAASASFATPSATYGSGGRSAMIWLIEDSGYIVEAVPQVDGMQGPEYCVVRNY